nr:uncharacterized protein LOC109781273 isoform X2 [Aegilops tauschii subsp. strangulata]
MPEIVRCASTLSLALLRALSHVHGSPLSTELQIHDTSSEDTVDDVVEDEWFLLRYICICMWFLCFGWRYMCGLKIYLKLNFQDIPSVSDYVLMIVGNSYLTDDAPCRYMFPSIPLQDWLIKYGVLMNIN